MIINGQEVYPSTLQPGMKINHLTILNRVDDHVTPSGNKIIMYNCLCDCGKTKIISGASILSGSTKTCGHCTDIKIGDVFGHLTVIDYAEDFIGKNGKHNTRFLCQCDCENHTILPVLAYSLKNGHTSSCGCQKLLNSITHHLESHPLYNIYQNMKKRCYNKNMHGYENYGAKGIGICKEWYNPDNPNDPEKIMQFVTDMEPGYSKGLTIERIDRNLDYSKNNCRWTDKYVQANNKSNNVYGEFNGEKYTIGELARIYGVDVGWFRYHIKKYNNNLNNMMETIQTEIGEMNFIRNSNGDIIPKNAIYFTDEFGYVVNDIKEKEK